MALLREILAYCEQLLEPAAFDDYCPNGLQVEGQAEVATLVTGVTASQALLEAAIGAGADVILVHHGYFWRGEAQPLVGMKGQRVRTLMRADVSLLAYHLPLDAHPTLGNNRQLGLRLGLADAAVVEGLLWGAELDAATAATAFAGRIERALGRPPTVVGPTDRALQRVAWCTGAAQGMIEQAAAAGFDAFVSGEISEQTMHQANELGLVYFAAGHHATERYGVQALGNALVERFGLSHTFIDLDNPV